MINDNNKMILEKCVCCGTVTAYFKNTSVKNRLYYVNGCGQLCKKCHDELFRKQQSSNY